MSPRPFAPLHAIVRLSLLVLVVIAPAIVFVRPVAAAPSHGRALHGYADVATNDFGGSESWGGSLRLFTGHDQTGEALAAYCIQRRIPYPRGTDPDLGDANSGFAIIGDVPRDRGIDEVERSALAYALWRYGDTTDDQTAGAMFLLTHLQSGDPDFGSTTLETTKLGSDWPAADAVMARAVAIRDESIANRGPWTMTVDVAPSEGVTMRVTATLRGPGGPIRGVDVILATDNADGDATARTDGEGRIVRTVTVEDPSRPVVATATRATTPAYYRVFQGRSGTQQVITSGGDGAPVTASGSAMVPRGGVRIVKTTTNPAYQSGAGAVFDVRRGGVDGDVVATITVGADGVGAVADLVPGRYTVVETVAPAGQRLDPSPSTVEVTAGETATVARTNVTVDDGAIRLVKTDGDTAEVLAGAAFEVAFDADGDGTYETPVGAEPWLTTADADAPTTITDLAVGRYRVSEVQPPPGYTRPEADVGTQVVMIEIGASVVTVDVENRQPMLATQVVTPDGIPVSLATAGSNVVDQVRIDNVASDTTATVTARLYGPFPTDADIDCGPEALVAETVFDTVGSGVFASPEFVLADPGIYTFVESAAFDDDSTATHECGLVSETVAVPGIVTEVSDSAITVGGSVIDVARITGVRDGQPGRVDAVAYGPFDDAAVMVCDVDTVAFEVGYDVVGSGSFPSPAFTPAVAGVYTFVETWTAADGSVSVSHACGEAAETVIVHPTVLTQISLPDAVAGESIFDTASVVGIDDGAVGSVTFSLHGPFGDDEAVVCSADRLVATTTVATVGGSAIASPPMELAESGRYTYLAEWRPSAGPLRASHACGLVAETTTVRPPGATTVLAGPQVVRAPRPVVPAGPALADTGSSSLPLTLVGVLALVMGLGAIGYCALDERRRFRDYWVAVRIFS